MVVDLVTPTSGTIGVTGYDIVRGQRQLETHIKPHPKRVSLHEETTAHTVDAFPVYLIGGDRFA
jgi:ABC-type multidrug transport system ATPase subunit